MIRRRKMKRKPKGERGRENKNNQKINKRSKIISLKKGRKRGDVKGPLLQKK